ncbi:MAG TPA: adenylate/guanylate cyclase domain-containing protein [Burkholderiales bacterium]|nr:adenylate/guanylate cyclase domain-containing protein [Burkholderiales bacterium]
MQTVREWLEQVGLPQYAEVFVGNDVDLDVLRFLSDADLEKLGVSLGHRKRLLNAISRLDGAAPAMHAASVSARLRPTEAERRQLTVMFCDLVGSTALAYQLDPEQLQELMRAYRQACVAVIERYDGHVAQYLGDGLMVYFGWPRAHEDDAERALRASLEIVAAIKQVEAPSALQVRVGIATGPVVVGDTATGDASVPIVAVGETPNLAARLQALAGADQIVIAPSTRRLVAAAFDCQDLGTHALKGIVEPVHAWRVLGLGRVEGRFEATHAGSLAPLVGREEELALLLARWSQAKAGEGQAVLLCGEPGIGKSRVAHSVRERIEGQAQWLRFQCSPFHTQSALYPMIARLERAAGFVRDDRAEDKLDKLESLLRQALTPAQLPSFAPLLATLLSLPSDRYPPLDHSPQKRKKRTLEALIEQLLAPCVRQPLLIVFEDVHWVDPTTQELLDLLVPRIAALPVLLLLTYRPEYAARWSRDAHVTALTLHRLNPTLGTELAAQVSGGKRLPAEVLEQIVAKTDGVPLFVEELTKAVLESGLLKDHGDRYVLAGPFVPLAIPSTLQDSLMARLDRLAEVREVAQIGACIGREFAYDLLSAVAPLPEEKLLQALEQLASAELIFRRGVPPDAHYSFKHALVQEAAYASLLKSRRQVLHRMIAEALEKRLPETKDTEPELLARHYTAAGLVDVAIDWWQRAGELALRGVALHESISHLSRGLELTGMLPASEGRDAKALALRTSMATAWIASRGWAATEVEASLTPALELAKSLGHKPSYLPVLYGLWAYDLVRGRVAQSLRRAVEMQDLAADLDDGDLRLTAHRLALVTHFFLGNLDDARRHADGIGPLYTRERGRRIEALTNTDPLTARGIFGAPCLWMLGYPDEAKRLFARTEAHARERGHPFGLCFLLTFASVVYDLCGQPERAIAYVEEAEQLARSHGIPLFSGIVALLYRTRPLLRSGPTAEGIAQLRNALQKWAARGGYLLMPHFKAALAEGLALGGELEAGLQLIEECLAQIERPGWEERVWLAEVLRLKGWMEERQGMLDQAEANLRAALKLACAQRAKSWELRAATTLARLLKDAGRPDEALALLRPTYTWFTEGFDTRDLREAKALLDSLS